MFRCLLFALLLPLSAAAQTATQPPADGSVQQAPGSVEGRVTNAETGDGIAGATIRVIPVGRRTSAGSDVSTTSRGDGTFSLENVAPGTYFFVATQTNFTSGPNGVPQPRTPVQVEAGQTVSNIALQLSPAGHVRGKVVDDEGNPVAGARVQVFMTYSLRGKTQLRRISETLTDEQGKYALKTQGVGKYYVVAEPEAEENETKPAEKADTPPHPANARANAPEQPGDAPAPPALNLVRTFYPKSLDLDGATALDVSAGQDTTDITIQLRRAAAYHIRGKVEGLVSGATERPPSISLGPRGTTSAEGLGTVIRPQPDGTFDIPNVLPGSYTLTLTGREDSSNQRGGRNWRTRLLARQDVDVAAEDVNGIALVVVPLITLSGRLTVDDQDNANLAGIRVNLMPAGTDTVGGFQNVAVQADGSFALENVAPGEYTIRVAGMPSGAYVKSVLYNRQDVTLSGVDLTQGGGGEIEIVLRAGVGEVDGVIANGAAGAAMMVLAAENIAPDGSGVLLGNMQSNGTFAVKNVPPGRYYAFGVERWSPLWLNPDFLRQIRSQGESVDLPENGRAQVELPIITSEQAQAAAMPLGLTAQ